ncbi:hypothetical protein TorRG33x02_258490 [Trema orientale]|uniref:Uncharacterized protein n=1 Tax=Trema orientale TaxID=63057 RepID=A0A2P5D9E3_TREOI|nr:hypothetical protein TorRG33x02_258490 [Trema orientale]
MPKIRYAEEFSEKIFKERIFSKRKKESRKIQEPRKLKKIDYFSKKKKKKKEKEKELRLVDCCLWSVAENKERAIYIYIYIYVWMRDGSEIQNGFKGVSIGLIELGTSSLENGEMDCGFRFWAFLQGWRCLLGFGFLRFCNYNG